MTFGDAIRACFSRYATFRGRAIRSEFWYFVLFIFLGGIVTGLIDGLSFGWPIRDPQVFNSLFGLVTVIPSIAVAVRRLHDTNRSGWWWWLWLIPVVGWIILIVFYATEGTRGPNDYGDDPFGDDDDIAASSVPPVARG